MYLLKITGGATERLLPCAGSACTERIEDEKTVGYTIEVLGCPDPRVSPSQGHVPRNIYLNVPEDGTEVYLMDGNGPTGGRTIQTICKWKEPGQ